jgi:preprotein translocase subunit SecE
MYKLYHDTLHRRRRQMLKFVGRARREMITVVWPQEKDGQNKETEKTIKIKS